ncbi:MAG: response regulator [Treponema sp.]|nr:response regulator [Treponema sp.]
MNSILIVDDDSSNLLELNSILMTDYIVYAVSDGTSALEKANESQIDLILLDVIMPDMSGFEVLAELKKSDNTKHIPVIFITSLSEERNESEGLALGAVDYIRKPFTPEVVKLRVSQQIKIINLQRDLEHAAAAADAAAKTAEAANKSKSSFLANMSHEIRTPMNAIMGVTDILMQNETLADDVTDGLEKIYASSEMLLGIINDILDFSKIEAGKLDIILAPYKVASMINDAVHLNMMRIGNRPIKFELKIDENIPANLIGDELRIKQILNNILSNAFKYTDAGKVTMTVKYESDSKNRLVLTVKDTGHGMTQDQLKRLFDEYSRFSENSKRSIEGTGLGLSILHRLVNLMDGEVRVESELNKGTTVTIWLPQASEGSEILGIETAVNLQSFRTNYIGHRERARIKREPMPYGSVLIVDDTETNLFVAVKLMNFYKLQIETAINGQEAVKKVKVGKEYDIIFMDHMMPEMDGIEATKQIREWEAKQIHSMSFAEPPSEASRAGETRSDMRKHITIIALTANAVAGQADIFLENGFDDFISKPLDVHHLDSILIKHIRDKQSPEVIEAARKQYFNADTDVNNDMQTNMDSMLLESFVRDARKAVVLLEEFLLKSDFENEESLRKYTVCVHGMKSTLGVINDSRLSEFANKLEQAGRDRNISLIKEETSCFINDLRLLLKKTESKQTVNNANDTDDLLDKLLAIKEICSNYNRKGALDKIAEINSCSEKTRAVLNNIMENVLHSDFEKAENLATEYIAELRK